MGNSLFRVPAREPASALLEAERAAQELGCDLAYVRAVWRVESAERWTNGKGEPVFRFEPATFDRSAGSWRQFLGLSRAALRRRFVAAVKLDRERAFRASSWSVGQIMGLHFRALGYSSASSMVDLWALDPSAAVSDWVRFLKLNGLDTALRNGDLRAFARGYNGSGNVDAYSRKLASALHGFGVRDAVEVLSFGARGPAVKRLQRLLGVQVDGFFGPETRAAVLAFQEAAGLRPDGIVGRATWPALIGNGSAQAPVIDETDIGATAGGAVGAGGFASAFGFALSLFDRFEGPVQIALGAILAFSVSVLLVLLVLRMLRRG